jgi:hypothetical protein
MRTVAAALFFSFLPGLVLAQQTSTPTREAPPRHASQAAVSQEDAQALRQDLARMRALVQQMQTNLAFVTTIQGPLKHQFELEIEMWQLQISSMERRLGVTPPPPQ